MGIHYKPSQVRGKRLVYRTADPSEPKREAIRLITFLALVVIPLLATFVWRWAAS